MISRTAFEAGIPMHVIVQGDWLKIPSIVGLSAYRIVQESLTSCLKTLGRVSCQGDRTVPGR